MKLNFLNINFQSSQEFLDSIEASLFSDKKPSSIDNTTLYFDSEKTFTSMFTFNKLQILRAISQLKPESVYKLASYLDREPQHVLKDCRLLESLKFLLLEETAGGRGALMPKLTFEYDVVRVNSKSFNQPFTISERAERLINEAISESITK